MHIPLTAVGFGNECDIVPSRPFSRVHDIALCCVQAPDTVRVVYQVLRQFSKIYSMNLASVTWPRDKVEHLRLLLAGQIRELENCVRNTGSETRPRRSAAVHNYFRKLGKFLKRKRFSACAWEITRAETRACLQQLPLVMTRINETN
ncbi:interferon alpha-2-like [Leucoraja erinacea]|uniref:interferon alpha-2-like n=1 Tax=Leucoraja erinaceus TaxID=7782 RepID=UPI0024560192|nr:interferon alpha-2-like [Leucoraja erinacea]